MEFRVIGQPAQLSTIESSVNAQPVQWIFRVNAQPTQWSSEWIHSLQKHNGVQSECTTYKTQWSSEWMHSVVRKVWMLYSLVGKLNTDNYPDI